MNLVFKNHPMENRANQEFDETKTCLKQRLKNQGLMEPRTQESMEEGTKKQTQMKNPRNQRAKHPRTKGRGHVCFYILLARDQKDARFYILLALTQEPRDEDMSAFTFGFIACTKIRLRSLGMGILGVVRVERARTTTRSASPTYPRLCGIRPCRLALMGCTSAASPSLAATSK